MRRKIVPYIWGEGGCLMCNPTPLRTKMIEGDEGHPPYLFFHPSTATPKQPKSPKVKKGYTAQQFIEWDNEE